MLTLYFLSFLDAIYLWLGIFNCQTDLLFSFLFLQYFCMNAEYTDPASFLLVLKLTNIKLFWNKIALVCNSEAP